MLSNTGRTNKRKNGILNVANPYLRIPYCLLRSDDFLALDPVAVKVYFMILRHWRTDEPDEPVVVSITQLRRESGDSDKKRLGRNRIMKGIKQLIKFGFIHKHAIRGKDNKYYIEQTWYTGESR